MTFQEKIVILRKKKGLTQDEFASAVGVSRQAVYKWESGKSYPEVAKLLEIKILFGISIDDLLDENFVVELPEKKKRKRLPKAEKAAIEATVEKEEEVFAIEEEKTEPVVEKEPAAEVAAIAEAPAEAEEKAIEESAVSIKENEEAAPIVKDEEPVEPAKEETKKIGFFGRLFGRK